MKKYTIQEQKENRKKWVTALRSGKYKQGYSRLCQYNDKNEVLHCCLGVLSEITPNVEKIIDKGKNPKTPLEKAIVMYKSSSHIKNNEETSHDVSNTVAIDEAMNYVGLKHQEGNFGGGFGTPFFNSLVMCNDDEKLSFDKIADIIESEPGELFYDTTSNT